MKSGFVALVGRPNVGKSTLMNLILKTPLSIVSPKAQTTRERLIGIFTEPKGQMVFVDTPGIHRAQEGGVNEFMVQEAERALEDPQLVWYLVDPFSSLTHEQCVIDRIQKNILQKKIPLFVIFNKMDLVSQQKVQGALFEKELLKALLQGTPQAESSLFIHRISALRRKGVPELLQESWNRLPEGPLYYPDSEQVSDRSMRFLVAEKVREQLFYCLGDEVPYSCAVEIQSFKEPSPESSPRQKALKTGMIHIQAVIFVERESQKGIVIGQGAKKIKEIGQRARAQIGPLLGWDPSSQQKLFLGLQVEVLKDWSKNPELLKRLGYGHSG